MKINLNEEVLFILDELEKNGNKAYLVGGSLRDFFLSREHNDYDISTSASVEEMKTIFHSYKINDVGHKFGNLKISIDGTNYIEVTTFRKEGTYFDYRHPSEVEFVRDIMQDLKRRDFTINAMAYSRDGELIDLYGGIADIKNKILRTVGNPHERFEEDPIRMMRAVRLSAQLNFGIEEDNYNTIIDCAHLIKKISGERVRDELTKILLSQRPAKGMRLLAETGLLAYIIPDLDNSFHLSDAKTKREGYALEHMLCVITSVEPILELRLAALLHDITKPFVTEHSSYENYIHLRANMALMILKELRYPKTIIEKVCRIVKYYDINQWNASEKELKKMIALIGEEGISYVLKLREANMSCEVRENNFYNITSKVQTILKQGDPITKKEMKINGYDLLNIGFTGVEVGEIIELLYEEILEDSSINHKENLIQRAKELYENRKNLSH